MKTEYKLTMDTDIRVFYGVVTLAMKKARLQRGRLTTGRKPAPGQSSGAGLTHSKFLQVEYFFEQLRANRSTVKL